MNVHTDLKSGAACYIVQPGDSLTKIASLFGSTVQAVWESNRTTIGPNPNMIQVGQKLYIPD
jgi:nucleoid-associated protein YgaU